MPLTCDACGLRPEHAAVTLVENEEPCVGSIDPILAPEPTKHKNNLTGPPALGAPAQATPGPSPHGQATGQKHLDNKTAAAV